MVLIINQVTFDYANPGPPCLLPACMGKTISACRAIAHGAASLGVTPFWMAPHS
jgi:hypothetical protein